MADLAETGPELVGKGGDMKGGSIIDAPLAEYMGGVRERIEAGIDDYIADVPERFREMFAHALTGEKAGRIRPTLTYMTGDTFGIDRERLDELALATDLIHTASLIWDDLPSQDNSSVRRGKPALHIKYGVGRAELAAIGMLSDADGIIGAAGGNHPSIGSLNTYISGLVGTRGMALGQDLDLDTFGKSPDKITVNELDKITDLKTGRAIEMGIVGAAIIGSLPDGIIDLLKRYSYHAGIAYQAKDDLRDATETTQELGKTAGLDATNERPTYLQVLGEEGTKRKIAEHVEAANAALDELPDGYNPVKFREILAYFANK